MRDTINPWHELPTEAPFVLPSDRAFVDTYNPTVKGTSRWIYADGDFKS